MAKQEVECVEAAHLEERQKALAQAQWREAQEKEEKRLAAEVAAQKEKEEVLWKVKELTMSNLDFLIEASLQVSTPHTHLFIY